MSIIQGQFFVAPCQTLANITIELFHRCMMHSVVDPLGAGAVRVSEGSVEHRQMRPTRPSTATQERQWEYKHNLDLAGTGESGAEAMQRNGREVKARGAMEKDNMKMVRGSVRRLAAAAARRECLSEHCSPLEQGETPCICRHSTHVSSRFRLRCAEEDDGGGRGGEGAQPDGVEERAAARVHARRLLGEGGGEQAGAGGEPGLCAGTRDAAEAAQVRTRGAEGFDEASTCALTGLMPPGSPPPTYMVLDVANRTKSGP